MSDVAPLRTYEEINARIEAKKAVVLTAEEIIDYVDRKGLEAAAREVDVVTTATFGPMCSSGCFLNFGHATPRMRITRAWLDDVPLYCGVAAADAYLGATEIDRNDPANASFPGEFRHGGGHVIERLVAGDRLRLVAESYGTQDYPRRELSASLTIADLNQAIMVNPRNCYQNYNVAINCSDSPVYTYLGMLKPGMANLTYCSAGQLSPLLNDPLYETIGIGTSVWLAGSRGLVYAQGTQHAPTCERGSNEVPTEGAGTLALSGDMKEMKAKFVRGVSLKGYGVSLALGVAVPIPVLNAGILRRTTVRDRDILAPVIDYSSDYPQRTGRVLCRLSYAELRSGQVNVLGRTVEVGSMSSYAAALEAAHLLQDEIRRGDFLLSRPARRLPLQQSMRPLCADGDKR
jgi:L-aspartate semialdehyde sulfurtransferase